MKTCDTLRPENYMLGPSLRGYGHQHFGEIPKRNT